MDQEEHLSLNQENKTTKSKARHLRRKRLKNARKVELSTVNSLCNENIETNSKNYHIANIEQVEVITKSKARRLRKSNKKNIENSVLKSSEFNSNSVLLIDVSYKTLNGNKIETANNDHREKNFIISETSNSLKHSFESQSSCEYQSIDFVKGDKLVDELSNKSEKSEVEKNSLCEMIDKNDNEEKTDKVEIPEKTREEIKAEREAKKAAKAAAKVKSKTKDTPSKPETVMSPDLNHQNEVTSNSAKLEEKPQSIENKTDIQTTLETKESSEQVKSKAELKAERRAKQEAQRAAKKESKEKKPVNTVTKPKLIESEKSTEVPESLSNPLKKVVKKVVAKDDVHEVSLFKHLYDERKQLTNDTTVNSRIHPRIVKLGVQYANKTIVGSNDRCVALLAAVKELIYEFEHPPRVDFIRALDECLRETTAYLNCCRPLAVSMQNAMRHIKWQMTKLSSTMPDHKAKQELINSIDTYISEQIELAGKGISMIIQTKISDGDVILIYGFSSLVNKIMLDAHDKGKKFKVIVVDGRPWLEGREQLRRLAKHGIECSYVLINSLSCAMQGVSKVFLGAHAILANGAVMSRVGTAQIALMARALNVPVLVACETHKSCERVLTNSIVYNELGNPDDLVENTWPRVKKSELSNWRSKKNLNLLNITYDVTPANLVTGVVTELGILPCTSVPVILRIKPSEI